MLKKIFVSSQEEIMDVGRSFSYQFEDKQWISKLGIAALILFVPILNFALSGYIISLMRNVMNDSLVPLPNWDDLNKKFIDGLILVAARLIYFLPIIILFIPFGIIVISSVVSGNHNLHDIGNLMTGAGSLLFICLACVIAVYFLALSIIFPAIELVFAREGTFTSLFKLREAFDIVSRNAGLFFTAWIVYFVASLGLSFLLGTLNLMVSWIPCLGILVSLIISFGSVTYLLTINAYLFGQFGLVAFGKSQPAG
jgi:hypothetical protein